MTDKDKMAVLVADGMTIRDVGRLLGVSRTRAQHLWREVCADVGEQAR